MERGKQREREEKGDCVLLITIVGMACGHATVRGREEGKREGDRNN